MPRDDKSQVQRHRSLVRKILDNPNLPAYIAHLESPILNRLINYVGKEDAQELIAHATPEQVKDLIEVDVFSNSAPGREEQFDPDRFLEWLVLFEDLGPGFLAEKVVGLGEGILALTLDKHVVVVDVTRVGVTDNHFEAVAIETFANYGVLPKDEDSWPQLREILTLVWDADPDFIETVLARCCQRRSLMSEQTHIAGNDTLDVDVAFEREGSRRAKGFVTPLSAAVFLGEAKGASIEDLLIGVTYDPVTAMHLRAIRAQRAARGEVHQRSADQREMAKSDAEPGNIEDLLVEAKVLRPSAATSLLSGPRRETDLELRSLMRALGDRDHEALEQRFDEILFLANTLVAGTSFQGRVFTEAEAVQCVYATANLGITFCREEEPFDDDSTMLRTFLEMPPGLIKAFRIGYHLIGQLPFKAIVALVRLLSSTRAQRTLRSHRWLQERIAEDLEIESLRHGVTFDHIAKAKEVLVMMATLFDATTCEQLRIICDPVPCMPRSLESGAQGLTVNRATRYIRTPGDLARILGFLDAVEI